MLASTFSVYTHTHSMFLLVSVHFLILQAFMGLLGTEDTKGQDFNFFPRESVWSGGYKQVSKPLYCKALLTAARTEWFNHEG